MNPFHDSPAGGGGRFCTTRWSAILLSAQSQAPGSRAALAELCKVYWYPIYVVVRRRGYDADYAQDLTQGFFLHLVTLLDEAMSRLRQEYTAQGKDALFEARRPYLDPLNNEASLCFERVANSLQVSMGSIKVQIHRLRKQYALFLRQEVARTVCEPAEVDEEIHSLCEALIAAQGQ